MTTKNLKAIFLPLLMLFLFANSPAHAQTKKISKTQKVTKAKKKKPSKARKYTTDNGDYYNGHKIYTGPRGGRYYINRNGNKTYI